MRLFLAIFTTIFALAVSLPTLAQNTPLITSERPGIIALSGEGKISTAPDIAYITSGVISIEKNAREALAQNSDAMSQLIDILKNAGVKEKDIQTSNFSISPQYNYNNPSNNQSPKITNYRVSNLVSVVVRDLDNLGNIIDQIVSVGANSVNSVSFGVEDTASLLNEARINAMKNAIEKATLYADGANVKLGRIILISENGGFMPPPPVEMAMMRQSVSADSATTPMQSGELIFRANVNVQWEIEQ